MVDWDWMLPLLGVWAVILYLVIGWAYFWIPLKRKRESPLIRLWQLPHGWALESEPDGAEAGPDRGDGEGEAGNLLKKVRVRFSWSELGPYLVHEVETYRPGTARQAMDEFESTLWDRCREWGFQEGEWTLAGAVKSISFKHFGDETIAFRLRVTGPSSSLTFYVVAIRVKDRIAVVGYGTVRSVMGESEPGGIALEEAADLAARLL